MPSSLNNPAPILNDWPMPPKKPPMPLNTPVMPNLVISPIPVIDFLNNRVMESSIFISPRPVNNALVLSTVASTPAIIPLLTEPNSARTSCLNVLILSGSLWSSRPAMFSMDNDDAMDDVSICFK